MQIQMMATRTIKLSDIPVHLRAGELYRSLDNADSEDIIHVPLECFAETLETEPDLEEFRQQLRIMEFWMLDDIPLGIFDFCGENSK